MTLSLSACSPLMHLTLALAVRATAAVSHRVIAQSLKSKGGVTNALMNMVTCADFMPMVSDTVSCRYSCRRSACRMIPLRESQWVIGAANGDGVKLMWLCLSAVENTSTRSI